MKKIAFLLIFAITASTSAAPSVRIKDIARLVGVRDNQLVGYGIVVGLQGTGDSNKSRFTILSVISMLERLGIRTDQTSVDPKNMAAVIVTMTIPPFASSGQRIDVTVSAIGDAKSLQGGILLQTPLLAGDGKVYSVAQGQMSLGGGATLAGVTGGGGEGHKTTGRIVGGGIVEREVQSEMTDPDGNLTWVLKRPDFATATRVAEAINRAYRPPIARAENAERVRVLLPQNLRDNPVPFIARIEDILLQPDAIAKVIINERTGTIVFGENARISTVAVSHGNLTVSIKSNVAPNAPTGTVASAATLSVNQDKENTVTLAEGTSVRDLVRALNSIGAAPADIIAVLQAISSAGALHAEVEFI